MRTVAARTGLTPDLLRAWERRYAVVAPTRSAGHQRLYSDADIARLTLLRLAVESGRPISQVAPLETSELQRLVERDEEKRRLASSPPSAAVATADGDSVLAAALGAVDRLDDVALSTVLRRAALLLGVDEMLDGVLGPLLFTIGSLWHQGALRPANEHMATAVIRRTLSWMMEHAEPAANAPAVVVGTPSGQVHEMGAMLAAAAGASAGWRVVYLGPNLPARDLVAAAKRANAAALALSLVYPVGDAAVEAELRELRAALPNVVIVAGGSAANAYGGVLAAIGALRPRTLAELRGWFRDRVRDR
ncbi:MAG: cobalamin B12-binding domain-containing protein [Gemmatimonadetes bacterium]|nr:cobalamin B12-binding domain-containing protein [Gemmatimonadota bacterium]